MWCLKLIILLFCLKEAAFQISCNKHKLCSDCILDQSGCSWCASVNHTGESRCMPESTITSERCPIDMLQAPNGSVVESKHNATSKGREFHILPQKYDLKLRPGKPLNFNFTYKSTKNYPVDVYFLIDASKSMKSLRENTARQSVDIYNALNNMTNDVKLGFGTFIDKNAFPFASKINATYSFKHRLDLTTNYTTFEEQLKAYESGMNYDTPEGGLDAVCQAIVCKEVIGWRETSAKIIVYLSDGPYHAAGDGRMAGIFTPYDGKCYTVDNVYKKELEMDYPTVGMVNKLAIENEIKILFVVTNIFSNQYEFLSKAISGSQMATVNGGPEDSVILTKTLSSIYKNIITEIKLKVNMRTGRLKHFNISFDPDCSKNTNGNDPGNACTVKPNIDGEYNFTGTITLLEYQEIDKYYIDVAIEGFNDKLSLDVEVLNTCDCELKKINSKYCNDEILECGICKCGNDKYGEKCSCSGGSYNDKDNTTCIYKGDNVECSGRGHCACGSCKCYEGFEGAYCECSKDSCELNNGRPCGGEGRGKCECGTCKCEGDYMGSSCQCYKYDEACKTDNNKICSGRGNCDCGKKCKCNTIPEWDKRTEEDGYCRMLPCPSCHNLQCSYIETCVLCALKTNVSCPCEGLIVEEISMNEMDNKTDWNVCSDIRVDVGCYTKFLYVYNDDDNKISVLFTKDKNCAESYYIIGGAVLGSLLLIGILTLIIWKVTTELAYRREYTKFVEAHKEDLAGTCENPLYESPTTTFRNPAFRKRSVH